jgi:tetratricopeptide (TPR) repeat protein
LCQKEFEKNENCLEALFFMIALRLYQGQFNDAIPYMKKFEIVHNEIERMQSKQYNTHEFRLIDSRFVILYYELGKYYFDKYDFQRAHKWLFAAKSKFFRDPMLNFRLGICYQEKGNYVEARKYYKKQLEFAPEEPNPFYNIACAYGLEGNKDKAVVWLKKAVIDHHQRWWLEYGNRSKRINSWAT